MIKVIAALLALACTGAGAQVRQAVVNDPAQARGSDVRALVADDLEHYLSGGKSALPWSQHSVLAVDLQRAYAANEVAADQRFKANDSDIVVTGVVRNVRKTLNTPTVNLVSGPFESVAAFMRPGHDAWLGAIKPNDKVSVACRRVRQVGAMVGAYECEPRAAYVGRMADAYLAMLPRLASRGDRMAVKLTQIAAK